MIERYCTENDYFVLWEPDKGRLSLDGYKDRKSYTLDKEAVVAIIEYALAVYKEQISPSDPPWFSAKAGEMWKVTWDGRTTICEVVYSEASVTGLVFEDLVRETPGTTAPIITHAVRTWPVPDNG